jgi:hypothetical protein
VLVWPMAVSTSPVPTPNDSAGHVYLRVEEALGQDVPFLFGQTHQRMSRAVVASFVSHAAVFPLALFVIRYAPRPPITGWRWRRRRESDPGAAASSGRAQQGRDYRAGGETPETRTAEGTEERA